MRCHYPQRRTRTKLLLVALYCFATTALYGALPVEPPVRFFTNLADRLLLQQLGIRIREVQVAPTNQYSAAVHRVFQVTANICDAMSTNPFPTVFRPLFTTNGTGVFLSGFAEDNAPNTIGAWLESNPYDIPLTIAARKGFPNFNEFTVRTDVLATRKLQFLRPNTNSWPNQTNQMYIVGISNLFAVEAWNSYPEAVTTPSTIEVSNVVTISLSNKLGVQCLTNFTHATNVLVEAWQGNEFKLPLMDFVLTLSNSVYRFTDNVFASGGANIFENSASMPTPFPLPESILTISYRLVYVHSQAGKIIDCVILRDETTVDLLRDLLASPELVNGRLGSVWSTNRTIANGPTDGIRDQIDISLGNIPTSVTDWRDWGTSSVNTIGKNQAIDSFRQFFGLVPLTPQYPVTNLQITTEAPFSPLARLIHVKTWQANDPLVHHHREHLRTYPSNVLMGLVLPPKASVGSNLPLASLGLINHAYAPWGGEFRKPSDPHSWTLALRDAGVWSPSHWNLPTNESPRSDWLGRVHRGTPWQTIYLKSEVAAPEVWLQQFGDLNAHPTNDWRLASLVAAEFSNLPWTNRLSVNSRTPSAWAGVMDGLTVLSNSIPADQVSYIRTPEFDVITIEPRALQTAAVADGINFGRELQPGKYFPDVAALLATPELSIASPWLNLSDVRLLRFGLTDEAYEMLPSQLLALVRADPVARVLPLGTQLRIDFFGCEAGTYVVESSPDLETWTELPGAHIPVDGEFTVSFPAMASGTFFRARMVE